MNKYIAFIFAFMIMVSCSMQDATSELNLIKEIGNVDPHKALGMLDSISSTIENESEPVKMKYELLKIRLNDKADILPTSSKEIKSLVKYFNEYGDDADRQEAYFYYGSVLRDLQDFPSAIEAFLQSEDIASNMNGKCDSLMLRNTYSNLSYLSNLVQDNKRFLINAKKEYELSNKINNIQFPAIIHVADAYLYSDSIDAAIGYYDIAFDIVKEKNILDEELIRNLLTSYSYMGEIEKAEECKELLNEYCASRNISFINLNSATLLAIGEYYDRINEPDSAIYYNQSILNRRDDYLRMYDASRYLFRIFTNLNKRDEAIQSGLRFVEISDTLNLGLRQEMAATVNNRFNYYRDKEQEQALIMENQAYQARIKTLILCGFVLLISITLIVFIYRYRKLKDIMGLKEDIASINAERMELANDLAQRTMELEESKAILNRQVNEITLIRQRLKEIQEESNSLSAELRAKESILKEKIEQNKTIISLMHQTEFEINAEEIIRTLKKSGDGVTSLTEKGWRDLYAAVDKLWPSFKQQMCDNMGTVTDQQRQFCYLARAGFSNTQIQNMANLSRVTVWRWSKKNEWLFSII